MISRTLTKITITLFIAVSVLFFFEHKSTWAHPPADNPTPKITLKDPCALDPNNLFNNGSMSPGHDTPYGSLADGWEPFIFDGAAPSFRWVGNEQIDPNGSQQIVSSNTFDAGMMQTVHNLASNQYYFFRLGYSLAAKSHGGPNVRVDSIGRKVGVDPFGGTDPKSPNVIWGPDFFNGQAALNIPEMTLLFAARSPNATIFFRAIARDGSGGENRVWFDAACMQGQLDFPTATPFPSTATFTPPPTATRPQPSRPPATRVAQVLPTNTTTRIPEEIRAPDTSTPTNETSIQVASTATPRFARPDVTPSLEASVDWGATVVIGIGGILGMGALVFFGFGFLWWHKTR